MSIFDAVNLSQLECTRAERNISDDFDRKYITTRLEFSDKKGKMVYAVRSSCSMLDKCTVLYEDPVKISSDNLLNKVQSRIRCFGLHEISQEVKKDLALIEKLFHTAPDDIKRVY